MLYQKQLEKLGSDFDDNLENLQLQIDRMTLCIEQLQKENQAMTDIIELIQKKVRNLEAEHI